MLLVTPLSRHIRAPYLVLESGFLWNRSGVMGREKNTLIAVGGDKLSRGLTLEGLTISYYLRASRMYDTLMQMGRWFGYRPGYLDLCRLYTTPTLRRWYQRITGATAELQREFESMAAVQKTPEDFGLRVRQLPDGLLVTSPTKLRQAQRLRLSFSGQLSETVTFKNDDRSQNLLALERLTSELPSADTGNGSKHPSGYLWRGVPADTIVSFLDDYHADRAAFKARPQALIEYIREREASDELTTWTVLIANPSGEDRRRTTVPLRDGSPLRISHTRRADFGAAKGSGRYTVKRLVSPTDELIDLDKGSPDWKSALQHTKLMWELNPHRKPGSKAPTAPSGQAARLQRAPRNGVLLVYVLAPDSWVDYESQDDEAPFVGFALSFPESSTAKPVEYQVNKRLLRDQFGWGDDDFDQ